MLYSALLIHLTGGRIETHFHMFGSLAFLAFYRDWRILVTATMVVSIEHLLRGLLWSESVYGLTNPEWWRFLEHAFWVLFENTVLVMAIIEAHAQMRDVASRQAELEAAVAGIEDQVTWRTFELERSHEQYRALLETTKVIPWELDTHALKLRYIGPQVEALLGVGVEACLAPGFLEGSLHPEDRSATLAALQAVGKQGSAEIEARFKNPNGGWLWLRFIASSGAAPSELDACDADTPIVRGILLDVTEARQLELELRQAQKLESVGRLAAGVAHEINTPVQFVSDSVHFVRDALGELAQLTEMHRAVTQSVREGAPSRDAAETAAQAEDDADLPYLLENLPKALDRALDGLDRVTTIVRSMKEFAHPDQREMAASDLNHAINSTLVIARNEYKYVADVTVDLGDIPAVRCHLGDVNQAILNIVVNAAHAIGDVVKDTDQRGRITVRTRHEDDMVVISISDTGGGIPVDIRERIFDPFFTTKGVGKGTGQGLAIARSVIREKHGGDLGFETELGKGSTFFIRLPIDGKRETAEAA
jgi:PAS domain S-box-containing protein